MRTRFSLDPVSGEFKDRHGDSLGVIIAVTLDLAPNALEHLRFEDALREQLWDRAAHQCERCGKKPWQTWLQMHHRTYERLGHEELEDVELLCVDCHGAEHTRLEAAGTPLRRPKRQRGTIGGVVEPVENDTSSGTTSSKDGGVGEGRPTASQLEARAIDEIWAYYLELIPSRRVLDDKRRRIIRNGLHTVRIAYDCDLGAAKEIVLRAVCGLSVSPWHNGENPDRKKYLELRHALKGRGDESDDERIDKAVAWAVIHAPGRHSTLDPDKAFRYLEEVRYFIGKQALDPNATSGRDRAIDAYRKLKAGDYEIEKLDRSPWARFA